MATMIEENLRSFIGGAIMDRYLRVLTADGVNVTKAGASDVGEGILEFPVLGIGDDAVVRLKSAVGTRLMVASEPITIGNPVYAAAAGKVAASGTIICGTALSAATADGDIIEVNPAAPVSVVSGTNLALTTPVVVEAVVPTATTGNISAGNSGRVITNTGATGDVKLTLPAATVGLKFRMANTEAHKLTLGVQAGETIADATTGVQGTAGKGLKCTTAPGTLDIECIKAGQWDVFGFTGTWAAES